LLRDAIIDQMMATQLILSGFSSAQVKTWQNGVYWQPTLNVKARYPGDAELIAPGEMPANHAKKRENKMPISE
jgi:hypothetical protein